VGDYGEDSSNIPLGIAPSDRSLPTVSGYDLDGSHVRDARLG
jgi:hypothetical protein